MLVDTYDTVEGVRHAIEASRATGVPLKGIRLDSGDLDELSRSARRLLDDASMPHTTILASGDLEENQIADLVAAGAPIDAWGVGTELGTSRDAPALGGVYKLVADATATGWRPVWKRSPAKATVPGPKQVFRETQSGTIAGDVIAEAEETLPGRPLLEPFMRDGDLVKRETLDDLRDRAGRELGALPDDLRANRPAHLTDYPVRYSVALAGLTTAAS
jgi:nicotinate phosphoribosyltransferase